MALSKEAGFRYNKIDKMIFFLTPTRLQQFVLLPNIGHSHLVTLKLAQSLLPLASAIFAARGENFVYPSI